MAMLNYWTRSALTYRVPLTPLPPQAVLPLVLSMFYANVYTLGGSLLIMGVYGYAAYKGRTPLWGLRRLRSWLRAGRIHARTDSYRRRIASNEMLADLDFGRIGERIA